MEVISQPGVNSALVMWTQQGGVPVFFLSYCPSDRQMSGQTADSRQREQTGDRQGSGEVDAMALGCLLLRRSGMVKVGQWAAGLRSDRKAAGQSS